MVSFCEHGNEPVYRLQMARKFVLWALQAY